MKTKDKIILTIILIIALLSAFAINAQERKLSIMAGYKAIEFGATYTDGETELIFGGAISLVSSDIVEKRANTNDKGKIHNMTGKFVPAAFGLIGAKFDELSIIGKLGGAYVEQTINGKIEDRKFCYAIGVILDYKLSEIVSLRVSYDNVNAPMAGIGIEF